MPFYNIPPIVGPFKPVLTSPDTDIAVKKAPSAQNLISSFLLEDMVRSGQKNGLAQPSVCSKPCQNLTAIRQLFMERGARQAHYWGQRDIKEIHPTTPHIGRISPFPVLSIY
jgi:hypothetical protein